MFTLVALWLGNGTVVWLCMIEVSGGGIMAVVFTGGTTIGVVVADSIIDDTVGL